MLGGFADKLADITDEVLFGDIWERPELNPRDRSLITITALVVGGNTEQLPFHLTLGRRNGLTQDEIVETITHLAFYTGWPRAMSAITATQQTLVTPALQTALGDEQTRMPCLRTSVTEQYLDCRTIR